MKGIDLIKERTKVVRTEKSTQAKAGCFSVTMEKALRLMRSRTLLGTLALFLAVLILGMPLGLYGTVRQAEAAVDTVRVIVFPGTSNVVLFAAQEKGIFEKYNLAMDLTFTRSSKMQMRGILEGKWDIGHTAVDNVISYDENEGADFAMYYGVGGVSLHFFVQPDVQSFSDLKGKDFAVDAITTGFAFVLQKILHENGIKQGEYKLVSVGGTKQRYQAMKAQKSLHGTLLTPPFIGMARKAGFRDMGEITKYIPNYATSVGAARRSWAKEHSYVLERWVRAQKEACDWVFDPKNKAEAVALIAKNLKIPEAIAARSYEGDLMHPEMGLYKAAALPLSGIEVVLNLRAEMGFLKKPLPKPEKFYDLSFYQKATQ